MKKPWDTPKLVVLVRSATGERVLAACKAAEGTGANSEDDGCFVLRSGVAACGARGEMLGIGNAMICNICSLVETS